MSTQRKCKVAFIHPDLGIGGAERLILDIGVALVNKGHKVSFVTNHFDQTHAFEEFSQTNKYPVSVIGDWLPRSVCGICQAFCAYFRMLYLIIVYLFFTSKEEKPDVYLVDQIPMAVPFIKWSGNKVIYYCHHPDLLASPPGGLLKQLYRIPINWIEFQGTSFADVLLVNSKYTATVFRRTFPDINNDIQILYPTISSSYQSKIENRKPKSISEVIPDIAASTNSIIFLSINRFHPAKKLELALSGLEALKEKVSVNDWNRVHLIMAGGYDPQSSINARYFTKLIKIAERKEVTTNLTFLKSPSDDLKADLLLACDCLIYTPVNEHFGIVPLEAMIASKPVIACNSGGPCETVQHEVTGYLCEPTGDSLAASMLKMLSKTHCKKMGTLGKIRQEKYFSHATFTSGINKVIEDIVATGDQTSVIQEQIRALKIQNMTNEALEVIEASVSGNTLVQSDVRTEPEIPKSPEAILPVDTSKKEDLLVDSKADQGNDAMRKTELEKEESLKSSSSVPEPIKN